MELDKKKKPLQYDYANRYSSIFFNDDRLVNRQYPFNELTDQYLSWGNDWDYVENALFKFSPQIK